MVIRNILKVKITITWEDFMINKTILFFDNLVKLPCQGDGLEAISGVSSGRRSILGRLPVFKKESYKK